MDENKKYTILIIEDEEDLGDIFSDMVKSIGYEAVYRPNGKAALEYLEGSKVTPLLVMCDVNMPVMSGVEFLKHQIQKNLNLNVCMVTANSTSAVVLQAMQLGVIDYVTKPFKMDELRAKIERLADSIIKKNNTRIPIENKILQQDVVVGEGRREWLRAR